MNLTELSTRQWLSGAVAVALVALFGLTSIVSLPIQLPPDIEEPQISVANFWRAAAPEEMGVNIVEPQENVLRNTPGLTNMNSFIGGDQGFVNLTFAVGTDMQTARLDVVNNLTQATPCPTDAIEPQINAGGSPLTPGAASLLLRILPDNPNRELASYHKLIEDDLRAPSPGHQARSFPSTIIPGGLSPDKISIACSVVSACNERFFTLAVYNSHSRQS